MAWHLADWLDSVLLLLGTRERVDVSSAMKVNCIVKQHECGVCFFIMHLLQLAVHEIIVAMQYVSYRFETTEVLYVCICDNYVLFYVDDANTLVCFARKIQRSSRTVSDPVPNRTLLWHWTCVFVCAFIIWNGICCLKTAYIFFTVLEQLHQEQFFKFYDSFSCKDRV